jgi:hypothetical protein
MKLSTEEFVYNQIKKANILDNLPITIIMSN